MSKNVKITYRWTADITQQDTNPNTWNEEADDIVTDGVYDFGDWLSDNGVAFERDDADDSIYYVLDGDDRTGEAYRVIAEEPTDEGLRG